MSASTAANPTVVEKSADGVYLIAGSRVPLDTVVFWFRRGLTAEEIADKYPSLSLAGVYGAIAHYLNNRDAIDAYLKRAEADSERNRTGVTSNGQSKHLRERLLAREAAAVPS